MQTGRSASPKFRTDTRVDKFDSERPAGRPGRGWRRVGTVACIAALAFVATGCASADDDSLSSDATPSSAAVETIEDGVLTVGIFSYMPYVGVENGRIVGIEGELIYEAADRLGLDVEPVLSDFSGLLGAVQADRVDVGVGSIGWTSDRASAGLFTDQTYYPRQTVLHSRDVQIDTIDDLNGLTVGTGIGYAYVDSLQQMPDVDLRTYPDAASMLQDVELGRVDAVLSDPLINITYAREHSDTLAASPIESPTDAELEAHPDWVNFVTSSAAWYIPKNNPELEAALTEVIHEFYDDGTLAGILEDYGVEEPSDWLTPPTQATTMRVGVDRPDDWTAPSEGR